MKRTLEVVVWPKLHKNIEFKQTMDCLSGSLQDYCSFLKVSQSEGGETFSLYAEWDKAEQMDIMLQSKEFSILSGAIAALCEKSEIMLNDKPFSTDISELLRTN